MTGVGGKENGYNLFAYCLNNPVNLSDPNGECPLLLGGILVGGYLYYQKKAKKINKANDQKRKEAGMEEDKIDDQSAPIVSDYRY